MNDKYIITEGPHSIEIGRGKTISAAIDAAYRAVVEEK